MCPKTKTIIMKLGIDLAQSYNNSFAVITILSEKLCNFHQMTQALLLQHMHIHVLKSFIKIIYKPTITCDLWLTSCLKP